MSRKNPGKSFNEYFGQNVRKMWKKMRQGGWTFREFRVECPVEKFFSFFLPIINFSGN